MSMYPQKISVRIVTSLETWLQCLIVLRVLNTVNKWAVVFICYEGQRKEDGQRIQAWLLWWPFLLKPILASWAEAEENGSRNCQRRSVRCSLRRLLQEPLWSSLSMKRIQFWMHFKHEATRFPCLKGCCGLKRDACGPTSFLEYRHVALMWSLQVLTKAALVFDKILQSLNWQRQDSLLSTQSPCQDKPKPNLRDHKWPGHCRGNWCPQGLSVQNPRNVLSANHRTLDGCDAMAALLFSCKLQRSLLSVRSPAKSFLTSPSRWKLTRAKEDRCHQSVGPGIQRQAGEGGSREILEC